MEQEMIVVTLVGQMHGQITVCTNQEDREALACFLIDTTEHILRGLAEEARGSKETVSPASEDPSGRVAPVGTGEGVTSEGHGDSDSGC